MTLPFKWVAGNLRKCSALTALSELENPLSPTCNKERLMFLHRGHKHECLTMLLWHLSLRTGAWTRLFPLHIPQLVPLLTSPNYNTGWAATADGDAFTA